MNNSRSQLNVRVPVEVIKKLDEIVEFYQSNTKIGKVNKGDVLGDIIDKAHPRGDVKAKIKQKTSFLDFSLFI